MRKGTNSDPPKVTAWDGETIYLFDAELRESDVRLLTQGIVPDCVRSVAQECLDAVLGVQRTLGELPEGSGTAGETPQSPKTPRDLESRGAVRRVRETPEARMQTLPLVSTGEVDGV